MWKDFRWKDKGYAVHLKGKKLSLVTRTFLDFLLRQGKDVLKHNILVGQQDTGQVRSTQPKVRKLPEGFT